MADEPDNLVLRMLREMRQVLDEVRGKVFELDGRFVEIRKSIKDRQETTATGMGFAAHANIRAQALEANVAELKARIDRLEGSENRH